MLAVVVSEEREPPQDLLDPIPCRQASNSACRHTRSCSHPAIQTNAEYVQAQKLYQGVHNRARLSGFCTPAARPRGAALITGAPLPSTLDSASAHSAPSAADATCSRWKLRIAWARHAHTISTDERETWHGSGTQEYAATSRRRCRVRQLV